MSYFQTKTLREQYFIYILLRLSHRCKVSFEINEQRDFLEHSYVYYIAHSCEIINIEMASIQDILGLLLSLRKKFYPTQLDGNRNGRQTWRHGEIALYDGLALMR